MISLITQSMYFIDTHLVNQWLVKQGWKYAGTFEIHFSNRT